MDNEGKELMNAVVTYVNRQHQEILELDSSKFVALRHFGVAKGLLNEATKIIIELQWGAGGFCPECSGHHIYSKGEHDDDCSIGQFLEKIRIK